ncbi:hypothetical protein U3516DRAFT_735747 [Neocallimastix sp. 'constans']
MRLLCTIEIVYQIIKKQKWELYNEILEFDYYDVGFIINLILFICEYEESKVLELMIEYANKNNYVLDLNNKYNPEDSLACKKLLDHLQQMKKCISNLEEYTEIDINEIITELRFLETEEEEKNIYFNYSFNNIDDANVNSIDDDDSADKTIVSNGVKSEDIKYLRKNKMKKNPLAFINDDKINNNISDINGQNIDADVLKSMLYVCKHVPSCGDRYFKEDDTYHLIKNDNNNSDIKYTTEELSKLNYCIDETYETKEIYYYDNLRINDSKNLAKQILNISKIKINNKDEFDNKEYSIKENQDKVELYKDKIITKLPNFCNGFDKKMKNLYGENYKDINNNNFIDKINENNILYEGERLVNNENENKIFDDVNKNELIKILYKNIFEGYDDFINKFRKKNTEFESLFYNVFENKLVNELDKLDLITNQIWILNEFKDKNTSIIVKELNETIDNYIKKNLNKELNDHIKKKIN